MKLMIPITANLVSAESINDSASKSSAKGVTGKISEFRMHAPIATATGASAENSALHLPSLNFF